MDKRRNSVKMRANSKYCDEAPFWALFDLSSVCQFSGG
jgi:hypothetical protein